MGINQGIGHRADHHTAAGPRDPRPAPKPAIPHSRLIPMIIRCALFMELIDATAVLTALPQMAREFGEASVRMNLVVSLYMLEMASWIAVSAVSSTEIASASASGCQAEQAAATSTATPS